MRVQTSLKRGRRVTDTACVMEQRPLPEAPLETEAIEPRLEVVPDVEEEPETPVAEAEEVEEVEETEPQTADPLKLYVRQIGDGPF